MLVSYPSGQKDRQVLKIKELKDALVTAGYVSLDEQADALGLSRSTTWTILKAKHKNYGLSAAVINRVLRNPDLNSRIRTKIIEYIREKTSGSYGHNHMQLRRFIRQLTEAERTASGDTILDHLHRKRAKALPSSGSARDREAADRHKVPSPIVVYRHRSGRLSGA